MAESLLDKIRKSDRHVRMYALNGLAFTLANEAEDIMFWCYLTASGLPWEAAIDGFYGGHGKFKDKRRKTDQAVTAALANSEDLNTWRDLNDRVQTLLGQGSESSLRNLIGHNAVAINLYADVPADPSESPTVIITRHEVSQKLPMVERRNRKSMKVGEAELEAYCEGLIKLVQDLGAFGRDALKGDPTLRAQCG